VAFVRFERKDWGKISQTTGLNGQKNGTPEKIQRTLLNARLGFYLKRV
jgi:hypothetical protein